VDRVRGQHLLQARQPSPLERGDEALAAGRPHEALGHYQSQARGAGPARTEALYKEALCLERLRRPDEAAAVLERLGSQAEARWRVPALCRLWLLEVRRDRHAEADAVLRGLATDYRFEQLAVFVPDNERREMLEASHPGGTFDLLRHNPHRVRDLERALEAERLLGAPAKRQAQTKYELMQVCMVEGQTPRAISLAEELATDKALSADNRIDSILDLASLLCQSGQTHRALDEINRQLLAGEPGRYRTAYLPLLLARARVHTLMDQPPLAEKDLDDLFRLTADPGRATGYLDACLLRGVLRSGRGDADGAAAAWREGLNLARRTESMHVLSAAIMGSLLNELTTDDLKEMIAGVLGGTRSSSPIVVLFRSGLFPFDELATGLRATWQSPRGREYARRIALRDLPYREMLTVQMVLGVFEGCRAGAFPDGLTPEQDELLWRMFRDVAEAQWTGELAHQQAVQIFTAWGGATGSLGWAGLAPKLKKSIRGPMAYVMGHRYLRLRKPDEAKTFFREALADAARESVLARLAAAKLERMK
jgi:tetratricopeptide (TPR) repeat protein